VPAGSRPVGDSISTRWVPILSTFAVSMDGRVPGFNRGSVFTRRRQPSMPLEHSDRIPIDEAPLYRNSLAAQRAGGSGDDVVAAATQCPAGTGALAGPDDRVAAVPRPTHGRFESAARLTDRFQLRPHRRPAEYSPAESSDLDGLCRQPRP
jgi:hypothetical protein